MCASSGLTLLGDKVRQADLQMSRNENVTIVSCFCLLCSVVTIPVGMWQCRGSNAYDDLEKALVFEEYLPVKCCTICCQLSQQKHFTVVCRAASYYFGEINMQGVRSGRVEIT